jgi:hypothetical protein
MSQLNTQIKDELFSAFNPQPKKEVVTFEASKPQEVEPTSDIHRVYLYIRDHHGIKEDDLITDLRQNHGLSHASISAALTKLFARGHLKRTKSGLFNKAGRELYYFRLSSLDFVPRVVEKTKKVKAPTSPSKERTKLAEKNQPLIPANPERTLPVSPEQEALSRELEAINATISKFEASPEVLEAQRIRSDIEKLKALMPKDENGEQLVKPISNIVLEIGRETHILTLDQAKVLYLELSLLFKAQLGV